MSKCLTTEIAFESFQVSQLMFSERFLRLECLVAGSTLENFSCHVFLLHVSHQLIFALEQEAAVIALQEPRMALHVRLQVVLHIVSSYFSVAHSTVFLLM
jgi:hypothetical protein